MVLKSALGFVVIFSLINSIECACRGTHAILYAINESNSAILDAINELHKEVEALKDLISNYTSKYSQPHHLC